MSKLLFAVLCFISTGALAQIDPVDQDPNLGHYVPTAPTGLGKITGQVSAPRSPSSPVAAFGVVSSVLPGTYSMSIDNDYLSGSLPFTTVAGQTTTVNVPAITLCGSFYNPTSPNDANTHVDLLPNRRLGYDITSADGSVRKGVAQLDWFRNLTCASDGYLAAPGHYKIQPVFTQASNPANTELPSFKPLEFDVASSGVTHVTAVEEDLRANISTAVIGKASFTKMGTTHTGPCGPTFEGMERHLYLNTQMSVIDHARNRGSIATVMLTDDRTFHVWPIATRSPWKYFVSIAGMSQPLDLTTSGQTVKIETKIVNVNDVFIKTSIPGKQDYYVAGTVSMVMIDPATRETVKTVQYQHYASSSSTSCAYSTTQLAETLTTFPTKRSFELLPGLYNVVITYTHPEEQKRKKQTWELDCTVAGAGCTGKLVSEGPALD